MVFSKESATIYQSRKKVVVVVQVYSQADAILIEIGTATSGRSTMAMDAPYAPPTRHKPVRIY
jgi:hypothetical protein